MSDLYTQFKAMIDKGIDPVNAAFDLGLSEEELQDFTTAYWDHKGNEAYYAQLPDVDGNDFDVFDGEGG